MRGAVLAAALSLTCAHARWEPIDRASLPGADAYPESAAVVLLDATEVRFWSDGGHAVADVTHRRRDLVLRPSQREVPPVAAYYSRGLTEVVSLRARILGPEGEKEVDGDAAIDAPAIGGALYADTRRRSLPMPATPARSVVEWESIVRYREPALYLFGAGFGGTLPVLQAELTVTAPPGWQIEWLARRDGEAFDFAPKQSPGRWRWEMRGLEPMAREPWGPSPAQVMPSVLVRLASGDEKAAFADARALSAWVAGLVAPAQTINADMRATVEARLAGAADPGERARRLYQFVSEDVQYSAIELGYGAWVPHKADEVFRVRYGDCKDKANLLQSLLAAAGVPSRLALIYAHDGWPRPFGLPALTNFNHVILIVDLPGGSVLADPTQQTVPFGELPPSDREADLLPVAPGGVGLMRTPADEAADNLRELTGTLRVGSDGLASGEVKLLARGAAGSELRLRLLHSDGKTQRREAERELGLSDAQLFALAVEGGGRWSGSTSVSGAVEVRGVLRGPPGARLLRLSDFAPSWVPALPAGPRRTPFVAPARRTDRIDLAFELPEPLVAAPSPPQNIATEFGSFSLAWESSPGQLRIRRSLVLTQRLVPAAKVSGLRAFFDAVRAAESRALPLHFAEAR